MTYTISTQSDISGKVNLPVSKSLMNRYLIMRFLSGQTLPHSRSTYPDDVNVLLNMLLTDQSVINAGDAGTAMRFGTALFSTLPGTRILVGSSRMHQRPIKDLVEALNSLGADINYKSEKGYPPLEVEGKKLKGGSIIIPADVSSQFVSAILMISPMCEQTVTIEIKGFTVSKPYIDMTIGLMEKMGVKVQRSTNKFIIQPQSYKSNEHEVEKDWSAASFFYQACALSENSVIEIPGLTENSLQGDRKCIELFALLGVKSEFNNGSLIIRKTEDYKINEVLNVDFTETPDLVQPFVMACAGLGIKLVAQGLYNLHLKETDRLKALQHNVSELGGELTNEGTSLFLKESQGNLRAGKFNVFNDHRMAMSLAMMAIKIKSLKLDDTEVVTKSFPDFWKELENLGFMLT